MVIQPPSTRLIKPNFCFDLSHRRSTKVSLEVLLDRFVLLGKQRILGPSKRHLEIVHNRLEKLMHYSCESAKEISEQYHIVERSGYIEPILLEIHWRDMSSSIAGVGNFLTLRFCRATLKVWPVKCNLFLLFKEMVVTRYYNIISYPWHLLASIWKYSVIFIIAESLAIWSIHKLLEYSRCNKGDQLEICRSQSFCLMQSVCYN